MKVSNQMLVQMQWRSRRRGQLGARVPGCRS